VAIWLTTLLRRAPERLVTGRVVGVEVGVAKTGLLLGAGRATSSTLNVTPDADPMWGVLLPEQVLSRVTTSVLFALAGGIAG